MARNVEIKARAHDPERVAARAQELSGDPAFKIQQTDTFFNCPNGRLKLRILGDGRGELIFYQRPDQTGPKTSQYEIWRTENPEPVRELLSAALGTRGEVRKKRSVFLVDQTRLHLDEVEGLGDFLELEVVLGDEEGTERGEGVARELMNALGVEDTDLVTGAYIDLMTET